MNVAKENPVPTTSQIIHQSESDRSSQSAAFVDSLQHVTNTPSQVASFEIRPLTCESHESERRKLSLKNSSEYENKIVALEKELSDTKEAWRCFKQEENKKNNFVKTMSLTAVGDVLYDLLSPLDKERFFMISKQLRDIYNVKKECLPGGKNYIDQPILCSLPDGEKIEIDVYLVKKFALNVWALQYDPTADPDELSDEDLLSDGGERSMNYFYENKDKYYAMMLMGQKIYMSEIKNITPGALRLLSLYPKDFIIDHYPWDYILDNSDEPVPGGRNRDENWRWNMQIYENQEKYEERIKALYPDIN